MTRDATRSVDKLGGKVSGTQAMTEMWDDQERRPESDQVLRPPVVRVRRGTRDEVWGPGPGHAPNFSIWMRWGFPAGLTIGILIGFFVALGLLILTKLFGGALP